MPMQEKAAIMMLRDPWGSVGGREPGLLAAVPMQGSVRADPPAHRAESENLP